MREACSRFGIAVDVAGAVSGSPADRPEELLPGYDLVFAKARAALEALAVGAAVVLCDQAGAGPLVTSGNLDQLRPLNFGIRTLRHPVEPDFLARQIKRYDAADAAEVSRRVRTTAGIEEAMDQMVGLYENVLAEHRQRGNPPPETESRTAAEYLRWLSPYLEERSRLLQEHEGLSAEAAHLRREIQMFQATATWRLREKLLRFSPLVRAYRWLRRSGRP